MCPAMTSPHRSPMSSSEAVSSGSAITERMARARKRNRLGASVMPAVAETISSNWWASSITTTSCSGRSVPFDREVHAVEVGVDHDDVGFLTAARGRPRRRQVVPIGQRSAPGHSSQPTLTADHAAALGSHAQLGPIADLGVLGPGHECAAPRRAATSRPAPRRGRAGRPHPTDTSATRWRHT